MNRRRLRLALGAFALGTVAVGLTGRRDSSGGTRQSLEATLNRVVARQEASVRTVEGLAQTIAADADVDGTLGGDQNARIRLFNRFAALRAATDQEPSIALVDRGGDPRVWAGRIAEPGPIADRLGRRGLHVRETAIAASLVATAPVARGGTVVVEVPVRMRRNITNEYLQDFDVWIGDDVGAEIAYADANAPAGFRPALPPLASNVPRAERLLRGPSGNVLALLRVTPAGDRLQAVPISSLAAGAAAFLAVFAALFAATWPLTSPAAVWVWAATTLAVALGWKVMIPPASTGLASLFTSDVYATGWAGLERGLGSPADLLLASVSALCAGLGLVRAADTAPAKPSFLRFLAACAAVGVLVGFLFAVVADVADNANVDLTVFAEAAPLAARVLQLGLMLFTSTGLLLAVGVLRGAGFPDSGGARLLWGVAWLTIGLGASVLWWWRAEVPPWASGSFYAASLALTLTRGGVLVRPERHRDSRRVVASLLLILAAVLSLQPALVAYSERHTRALIQSAYAPFVAEQPLLRRSVLDDARHTVDRLSILDPGLDPAQRPPIDQLAFAVWSRTELSTFGLSSGVEIQDAEGRTLSRFGLNFPALSEAPKPTPAGLAWRVARELRPLGSVEQPTLHASRALPLPGRGQGSIHLFVSEDYWNLPFLTPPDPYSLLYRPASLPAPQRGAPVNLFVFDRGGRPTFFSTERPPVGVPYLAGRPPAGSTGFWTQLDLDGQPVHAFVLGDEASTQVLSYARTGIGRRVFDLMDAAGTTVVAAAAFLLGLLLVRTLMRRRTFTLGTLVQRVRGGFAWRLLLAFVLLAVAPVAIFQVVATRFVRLRLERAAENQSLQRAYVSQKAVEDYASLQGDGGVTDDALAYVASLLRNDLALFEQGRLVAASQRDLYSSGLLPLQVDADAFRLLSLEGRPYALGDERIGGFSYRVVSVPVTFGPSIRGILSLPLTFQRGVGAIVDDLRRTIRLASLLFLVTGAAVAYFMAWRISGPVSELTRAARRIAAGDLGTRVEVQTRDETATLVDAFNRMTADLERQREDLEKSNRRAAWADMARQVAHEVKNPLTPIRLSAEHMRRVYSEKTADFGATLWSCTGTILTQVERLRGIATEFSAFARPAALDRARLDPVELVRDAVAPYRAAPPLGVSFDFVAPVAVPPVVVDRRLVERALVNLVENAVQAVGDAGHVRVEVRAEDSHVVIDVIDSGPGIEPALRSRLFEPFFSTKTGGSGLGLALSREIAEDHGGGVDFASGPGEPTRIRLWLPQAVPTTSS